MSDTTVTTPTSNNNGDITTLSKRKRDNDTTVNSLADAATETAPKRVKTTVQTAEQIKLAIVGFRDYNNYTQFHQHVDKYIAQVQPNNVLDSGSGSSATTTCTVEVVSGGCRGADTMGEQYAKEHQFQMTIFKPNWTKYPYKVSRNLAYTMRDQQIADYCTHMIAFPSKNGKGTQMTIEFAQKQNKPCHVIFVG
jgi:hypothetical protein